MSLRAKDNGQMSRRAAPGATRRLLWTLAALGSVSALGVVTAAGLTHIQLPKIASFTGHLQDTAQMLTVDLPRGVAVDKLMAYQGARARKGQTLVWLDLASIVAAISQLEATMAADQQLLACLQESAPSTLPLQPAIAPGFTNAPRDVRSALLTAATLDCANQTTMHSETLDALDSNDAVLAMRSTLIDRRIKLELAHLSAKQVERDSRARLVLGLAWEQTQIEASRAENLLHRREIKMKASAALSARIRLVNAALQQNEVELANLFRLQQDPRLVSPADAIILEVQVTAPDQVFDEPTSLIRFVLIDPQRFEVRLAVRGTQPHTLRENTSVQMELIGTAMRWPLLTGHVIGVEHGPIQVDNDVLLVRVGLEPESAAALAEMSARSRFVGDGAAIAVQAMIPEQPAATALVTAWAEATTYGQIDP